MFHDIVFSFQTVDAETIRIGLIQRTEAVAEDSIEYEYEYRDAEYEYEKQAELR